ncbi:RCC1 domain-containing protein [Enterococcus sp. AZ196]|uniref:RCC1 domain-containing protein n=1 Tax=Enterococcus sp. AZ196 TaxID=2774659 RepID=UPI003D2B44E5
MIKQQPFSYDLAASDAPARNVSQQSAVKFVSTANFQLGGSAIDSHGALWTWGYNHYGVQGLGLPETDYLGGMRRVNFFIDNNIKLDSITAGYVNQYAITTDGELYAWGDGRNGKVGIGSTTNQWIPQKVNLPEKVSFVATGQAHLTAVYAVTESGKVYAWGYGSRTLIPWLGETNTTPKEIDDLTNLSQSEGIKKIAVGYQHVMVLTNEGNLYVWGLNAEGQLGLGNTTTRNRPTKVTFFDDKEILDIDARFYHSMVQTNDNKIYEFGKLYGKGMNGPRDFSTPRLLEIDTSSASYSPVIQKIYANDYNGYFIDQNGRTWVWGGNLYYNFLTDGPLYGTTPTAYPYDFRDPLKGKLDKYLEKATQLPKTLGDGDTEFYAYPSSKALKAPVFHDIPFSQIDRLTATIDNYRDTGMWSNVADGDAKHPTIYDKKYYKTVGEMGNITSTNPSRAQMRAAHRNVCFIDNQDRKLVYVIRRTNNSPVRYSGNYYVASSEYSGEWFVDNRSTTNLPQHVTETTSVPEVQEDEKSWIEIATGGEPNDFTGTQNAEFPYTVEMSFFESSVTILDSTGNIYKQSYNGSGNIAWGWDYDKSYDLPITATGAADRFGLYDYYNYEIMFMRGSPRVIPGNIEIEAPREKHYKSQQVKEKVKIEIGLGSAYHSAQLNLTVEPELKETKYLIMPYDTDDPNIEISSPSEEEFNTAYNQAASLGYTALDLAEKNSWKGIKQGVDQPEVKLEDESIEVTDNCIIWVLVKTNYYGAEPAVVSRKIFDNYYTEMTIEHNGIDHADTSNILYKPTSKNVSKVTNDGIEKLVGFPLDKNGKVIGTKTKPPTFGYDKAKVAKLSDEQWNSLFDSEEVKDNQVEQQRAAVLTKTKSDFEASGMTWLQAIESKVKAWIDSWIEEWVEEEWLPLFKEAWQFYTPQSSEKTYTLNGVAAANNDNLEADEGELAVSEKYLHSFHYEKNAQAFAKVHYLGVDSEGEKLNSFTMETEEVLKKVTYRRMVPELLIDDIEYLPIEYKMTNGVPVTTFPINVSNMTEIGDNNEVTFKAAEAVDDITVNVLYKSYTSIILHARQVIQNSTSSIKRPSSGFLSLNNVKLPNYDQKFSTKNVVVNSGDINKIVSYNEYLLSLQKGFKGIKVDWITPQYYKYLGFVLTEVENEQNISKLDSSQNIHLNCTGKEVYWLTVYLEPDTTIQNYAWDQKTNQFGKVKIP